MLVFFLGLASIAIAFALAWSLADTPDEAGDITRLALQVLAAPGLLFVFGATARRLRALGKTQWYFLLLLIPCAFSVLVLFLMAAPDSVRPTEKAGS